MHARAKKAIDLAERAYTSADLHNLLRRVRSGYGGAYRIPGRRFDDRLFRVLADAAEDGAPAVHIAADELAWILGCTDREVRRATAKLEEDGQLVKVPLYRPRNWTCPRDGKRWGQWQRRNTYVLTSAARRALGLGESLAHVAGARADLARAARLYRTKQTRGGLSATCETAVHNLLKTKTCPSNAASGFRIPLRKETELNLVSVAAPEGREGAPYGRTEDPLAPLAQAPPAASKRADVLARTDEIREDPEASRGRVAPPDDDEDARELAAFRRDRVRAAAHGVSVLELHQVDEREASARLPYVGSPEARMLQRVIDQRRDRDHARWARQVISDVRRATWCGYCGDDPNGDPNDGRPTWRPYLGNGRRAGCQRCQDKADAILRARGLLE